MYQLTGQVIIISQASIWYFYSFYSLSLLNQLQLNYYSRWHDYHLAKCALALCSCSCRLVIWFDITFSWSRNFIFLSHPCLILHLSHHRHHHSLPLHPLHPLLVMLNPMNSLSSTSCVHMLMWKMVHFYCHNGLIITVLLESINFILPITATKMPQRNHHGCKCMKN